MDNKRYMLREKTVVITGASSGVGKAMAIKLAQHGANLVLAARREEALEETAKECIKMGGDAIAVPADMRSTESIQLLTQQALQFKGKVDVWINNAGVLAAGAFENIPVEVNEDVIRTNLIGYMYCAHAVLPHFKQQGYGILINNISVGGWFPVPYGVAYAASKFGIRGFSEALKGELKQYPDIHICDLYPGFLDTPGMQHAANYTGKALMPAPPVYNPEKVAKAVVNLILHPQSKLTIGLSSAFLRTAYHTFPALSRNITGSVIRAYIRRADSAEDTSGNVLHPVTSYTGIEGGWRKALAKPLGRKAALITAGLIGLTIGILIARKQNMV